MNSSMRGQLWRLLAAATIMILGVANPVLAQDSADENRDGSIQILSIEESDGIVELIVGLPAAIGEIDPKAENFGVVEGSTRRNFSVEAVNDAVDIVVLVDTSGSMRGAPLQAAISAAAEFIGQLPDEARVSVLGFGAEPTVLTGLDADRQESIQAVRSLEARGETALWDAVTLSGQTLAASDGEPYLVLLSDGGDTASTATQATATSALAAARAHVFAITIETAESDHSALNSMSDAVDGTVLATNNVSSLSSLYAEIGDRLSNRYRIRFETDRTDARTIRLSVAVDGAIATASGEIGSGTSESVQNVPGSLENPVDLEAASTELRSFTTTAAADLTGGSALWLGAAAFFLAIFATGFVIVDPFGRRIQSLGGFSAPHASQRVVSVGGRMASAADRAIASRDEEGGLDKALDGAGINMRPGEFAILSILLVVGAALLSSILLGTLAAFMVAGMAGVGVWAFLGVKLSRRRKAFAQQLHGTITIMVGSMRAGRGLPQALELVADESSSPTSEEFRRVVIESRVGRDPVASMEAVADRMDNDDLHWISQAIQINRELGGDLTELLDNLAAVIRDRGRVKLQVRSLSAEGRMSAWVVGILPIVMFFYMRFANPGYVELLWSDPAGIAMLVSGLVLMGLGALWMKKLVNIKY